MSRSYKVLLSTAVFLALVLVAASKALADIVVVSRGDEVRLVYRLAERRVDRMLARLEALQGARQKLQAAPQTVQGGGSR